MIGLEIRKLIVFIFLFYLSVSPIRALEYFGYYNLNGLDPIDSRDHIPEVGSRGNTNMGHITVSDISKLPKYLTEMRQYNLHAILGVTAMFESPTWQQNWQNIKTAIRGYEEVIYGFYFDESAWRGIGVNEFRTYTSTIRTDFPDKATMLIEGYPPISEETMPVGYLDFITDFGFDYYGTVEDPNNFENGWLNYLHLYQKIYHLSAYKKVWLVPDGYGYPNSPSSTLGAILTRFYEFAQTKPEVVGLLVFRYDPGDGTYYTIQDVLNPQSQFYSPGVATVHNNIGKTIIANSRPYPSPSVLAGDLNGDGFVNIYDFNWLVSRFGNPYTIFDFNAIVSNYED